MDTQKPNCPACGSTKTYKNGRPKGIQRYKCGDCKKEWTSGAGTIKPSIMTNKIGITLSEFRERHDLNFIVGKAMKEFDRQHLYEKADIIKLCNLRPGYPGLNDVLEQNKEFANYRGKIAGKTYWGHPEIIEQLKNEGQLT